MEVPANVFKMTIPWSDVHTVGFAWVSVQPMPSVTKLYISMQSTADPVCKRIFLPDVSSFPSLEIVRCVSLDFNTCTLSEDIVKHFERVHTLVLDSCQMWDWAFDAAEFSLSGTKRLELIDCSCDAVIKIDMPSLEELVVTSTKYTETCYPHHLQRYDHLRSIILDNVFLCDDFEWQPPVGWRQTLEILILRNAPIHIKNLEYICSLELVNLKTIDLSGATFVDCPDGTFGAFHFPFSSSTDARRLSPRGAFRLVSDARREGRWPSVINVLGA
jgi:hypothetical protein